MTLQTSNTLQRISYLSELHRGCYSEQVDEWMVVPIVMVCGESFESLDKAKNEEVLREKTDQVEICDQVCPTWTLDLLK